MPRKEVGIDLALGFMRKGEFLGGFSLPQRDQVYELIDRLDWGWKAHIPVEVVGYAYGFSAVSHKPIALIEHEPNYSVQGKSSILEEHQEDIDAQLGVSEASVLPLKTITIRFKHERTHSYVLFTRVGDYLLDRDEERDLIPPLKILLGVEYNPLRSGFTINPTEFEPRLALGIEPGLVSPFVRGNLTNVLKGLLYYVDNSFDRFVAIAVSLNDTLVIHKLVFHQTLDWWSQDDRLGVPYRPVVKGVGGSQIVVNQ